MSKLKFSVSDVNPKTTTAVHINRTVVNEDGSNGRTDFVQEVQEFGDSTNAETHRANLAKNREIAQGIADRRNSTQE